MWFVDHAEVSVKAGDGGRGCTAFAQPPYTRYPSADGGDGGDGGDVILIADPNIATLLDFHFRHEFKADAGRHGGGNQKSGKRGEDLVIRVPVGTLLREAGTDAVLQDLTRPEQRVVVAKGGRGGMGNAARVASAQGARRKRKHSPPVRPRTLDATPGTAGEQRRGILELKLIADVGIIGCPNAGKSSLLARISTARPKIGAYPFTTRYPVLGVVEVKGRGAFVACDIPGLIEGAHAGKGLGIQFLRHIERTRVLLHLVDAAAVDGRDPVDACRQVNAELAAYSRTLSKKPQLVVANKLDLPQAREHLTALRRAMGQPVYEVSAATGEGVPELLEAVWHQLQEAKQGLAEATASDTDD